MAWRFQYTDSRNEDVCSASTLFTCYCIFCDNFIFLSYVVPFRRGDFSIEDDVVIKPVFLRQRDPIFVNIFLRPMGLIPVTKLRGQWEKRHRNVGRASLQKPYIKNREINGSDLQDIYYPRCLNVNRIGVWEFKSPYSPGSANFMAFLEYLQHIWIRLIRERELWRLAVKSANPNLRCNAIAQEIPPGLRWPPTSKKGRNGEEIRCLPCSNNSDSLIFAGLGGRHIVMCFWDPVDSYRRTIE